MTDAEFDGIRKALTEKTRYGFEDLCALVMLLRDRRGCPWDREQSHASLRKNMLEEAYEAAEAIDAGDGEMLCEELGDVMLQVVLHSRISEEAGGFDIGDVCTGVCAKLILRHPHVFGEISVAGSGEVLENWEKIKRSSKGYKSVSESMDKISAALPALMRAQKIGEKAAKAGFDFRDAKSALEKTREELAELEAVLDDRCRAEEELGDLLLSAVNTARLSGIDAEEALNKANAKFCRRFALVEKGAQAQGLTLNGAGEEKKQQLWDESKKKT